LVADATQGRGRLVSLPENCPWHLFQRWGIGHHHLVRAV